MKLGNGERPMLETDYEVRKYVAINNSVLLFRSNYVTKYMSG